MTADDINGSSSGGSSSSDVAAPCVSDAVAWIRANREWLLDTWQLHGAVLLRGLPLESPGDFNEVVEAFGLDELPYVGGAAPRTKVAPRVFTANESPPDQKIPFHHEMAQLRAKGLLYVRVLPEVDDPSSAIGRGWKSTFLTDNKEEAESKAAKLGVKLEWQADGSVRTVSGPIPALRVDTRPLPSLSTKHHAAQDEVQDEQVRTGEAREEEVREAWFNSMVAAYTGWKDVRNDPTKAVTFGDGEALPGEAVLAVEEEMERLAVAVPWRRGDVLLVDNLTVQHSRRSPYGLRSHALETERRYWGKEAVLAVEEEMERLAVAVPWRRAIGG
ncbi:unnamed protein product [Closterium sp. Yama58-4]|nr:unnamed protein product [Closterium sp. Yama58-4]